MHASDNFLLVSAIETTFLNQPGPNLHEVFYDGHMISDEFNNERNLPSNSRVIGPERLKIAVFNLVSAIETTILNQSGPKLHKVFYSYKVSDYFDNE